MSKNLYINLPLHLGVKDAAEVVLSLSLSFCKVCLLFRQCDLDTMRFQWQTCIAIAFSASAGIPEVPSQELVVSCARKSRFQENLKRGYSPL